MENKYVLKLRADANPENWKIISKKITYDKVNEEKSKAKYKIAYDEAQREYEKELAEYKNDLVKREEYDKLVANNKIHNDKLSWWNLSGYKENPDYVSLPFKPMEPWASKSDSRVSDTITETFWSYYNANNYTKAEAFETLNEYTGFRSRKEAQEELELMIDENQAKAWVYKDYK